MPVPSKSKVQNEGSLEIYKMLCSSCVAYTASSYKVLLKCISFSKIITKKTINEA